MIVRYKFQSKDENGKIVGNKNKIYEAEITTNEEPNLINCVTARLFTSVIKQLNGKKLSPLGVRDLLAEAEELVKQCTYFELVEVK